MNWRALLTLRNGLIAGAVILVTGVAIAGTALAAQPALSPSAAQPGSMQPERGRLLDLVAAKLGIAPERLRQAFAEAHQELGPQRPGGPGGMGIRVRGMMAQGLRVAADAIGISPEQLRSELPGNSLAGVAQAHGVDPQRVTAALTTAAMARIDAGAAAGRITEDQAANLKQRVSAMIERLVNRELPNRPPGRRGPDEPFGPFGPRSDGPSGPGLDGPFGSWRGL
jgi:hypothetical protein